MLFTSGFLNGTEIGDEDSKLVAWSDSCGDQNRSPCDDLFLAVYDLL